MEIIAPGFIISSFVAGVLTFLAPCTLPLVPAYLGFISGVSTRDLKNPIHAKSSRRKIILNGVFFILGFSIVFILFGTLAGLLGQQLVPYRIWLGRIGGILVVLFGLFVLGVFDIRFLQTERRIKMPIFLKIGTPATSLAVGSAFAFGWTPCVGPILGSILLLASTSSTAFSGAFLLAVFSAGLAVPFLLVAIGFSKAYVYIEKFSAYLKWISTIGGVFLIALGILLITDNFQLLIQYGYQFFDFINYEGLLEYL
jgi:cytochrome c-type biogenesis protein